MNLSEFSVKRPVTVLMLMLVIVLLGVVSLGRLPIDMLPAIELPIAVIQTTCSGMGPQEVEKLITRPLEEAVARAEGIESINSMSSEGSSIIIAQFGFGTDMNFAALDLREKIDLVKGFLPADAKTPNVLKMDMTAMPVVEVALSNSGDLGKLQAVAEDIVKPRLERLEGVAAVSVYGGYENEVSVRINQLKLQGYGISVGYVAQIIGAENLNLPGGEVEKGQQSLTIRTMGEFASLDDIRQLTIPLPAGGIVTLADLADVQLQPGEQRTLGRTNGKTSIIIDVMKQSGENSVRVAEAVNAEIAQLQKENPGLGIDSIFDQAYFIKLAIGGVFDNAFVGGLLAVLILYLFLRNARTTLIIGVSIPISIIGTFTLLYFNGVTLNMMTLGGLALGIGMLVDNSIVVLENIFRFRQEGHSRAEAAVKGGAEVAMAVTASTLTTVAVFLPIVFVEGITATVFKELALTVTMSLLTSLIVSLTLVPMLSAKLLKINGQNGPTANPRLFGRFLDGFERLFGRLLDAYRRVLAWALAHRKATVVIGVVTFAVSIASIVFVGAEFFPSMDQGWVTADVSLPAGSELEETDALMRMIETKTEGIPEVDNVFVTVGSGGDAAMFGGGATNTGMIYYKLKPLSGRSRSSAELADEIRSIVRDVPGAEINVQPMSFFAFGGMAGAPVSISIRGDDIAVLQQISDDFRAVVEDVAGTREVETSLAEGVPEVQIAVDRKAASQYGLTAGQIAGEIRGVLSGVTASRFKYEGEEINIVVSGDATYSNSIANLGQTPVSTPLGVSVPLDQVAEITVSRGPITISREKQSRVVTVTSQIFGRDLQSVSRDIAARLAEYEMPQGYDYSFGGEQKELTDAFSDLLLALALAVILVYMIMASQFENLLHPFVIMFSMPLGFSGGILGLFLTGKSLSVPAFIGLIVLAGIVVNNAIVLIDYINIRRQQGESRKEAIMQAGPIRLRPILMTTLTTVLALFPQAFARGEGAEMGTPMAVVVIGGLLLSTLLTLVYIPVIYTIVEDCGGYFRAGLARLRPTGRQI
ncbi:MAG: efflux RND transporter permease subunit [bacterium]|jgi:HAE1 family hydrophobic/amphiphilic exporter-1